MKGKDAILMMDYSNEPRRDILCVDMISFFASCEAAERKIHPLKSNIAVVSRPETGGGLVLAASPLLKKKYKIKTGTRVHEIPKDADIHMVEPQMALYVQKNIDIVEIFQRYTSPENVYVYSIDEAFLDVTHSHLLFGTTSEIAAAIQRDIYQELGLIASIGIGDNPLLAKLALDHQAKKNDRGHYRANWTYEDVPQTIWKIEELTNFWGIGRATKERLGSIGIYNLFDLSQADLTKIHHEFGILGDQLFFHAHGIDRTILSDRYTPEHVSFSKNQILRRDYYEPYEVEIVIREMTEENAERLRSKNLATGLVRLSIGYSKTVDQKGFSHQMKIEVTDSSKKLVKHMLAIFRKHYEPYPVRTVNVGFGHIQANTGTQMNLFESPEKTLERELLSQTVQGIRGKYGKTSLLYASSLSKGGMALTRSNLLGGHQASLEADDQKR